MLVALSTVAIFFAPLRGLTVVLDLVFAATVVLDFLHTPRPDRLDVRRRLPARAGLGLDFVRTTRIDIGEEFGAAGLRIELDEEFSSAFQVRARTWSVPGAQFERGVDSPPGTVVPLADDPSGGPDGTILPARGPIDLVRVYRSNLRGLHGVSDMRVRLTSRLGLVQRSARLAGEKTIAIEPALLGLKKNLQLAASERWRDLGVRRVRRRGGMTEFESLRDHVHGDEVRTVDWKAFAKRGRPIVRQFQEERGQELILAIDCGRRMSATTAEDLRSKLRGGADVARGASKLDHALDTALQIAAIALQQGDRVGCIAFDSSVRAWGPPQRGRAHLGVLRRAIFALEPSAAESDLDRVLREIGLRHRRRALVLILSDVADPFSVELQARALRAGSRRHRIVFAGLDDPVLRAVVDGRVESDGALRASALALAGERSASLKRLRSSGARVLDALPAEAAAPLIAAWLEARRSGS